MTQWRLAMDEIEFRQTYDIAADAASHITAPETKTAVALLLQLVHGLQERLDEIQQEVEDDE